MCKVSLSHIRHTRWSASSLPRRLSWPDNSDNVLKLVPYSSVLSCLYSRAGLARKQQFISGVRILFNMPILFPWRSRPLCGIPLDNWCVSCVILWFPVLLLTQHIRLQHLFSGKEGSFLTRLAGIKELPCHLKANVQQCLHVVAMYEPGGISQGTQSAIRSHKTKILSYIQYTFLSCVRISITLPSLFLWWIRLLFRVHLCFHTSYVSKSPQWASVSNSAHNTPNIPAEHISQSVPLVHMGIVMRETREF